MVVGEDLLAFYFKRLSRIEPGLRPRDLHVRVGPYTLDIIAENAASQPVIVKIQRGRATLKTIQRVLRYAREFAAKYGIKPRVIIIAREWSTAVEAEAREYGIKLIRHLPDAPIQWGRAR